MGPRSASSVGARGGAGGDGVLDLRAQLVTTQVLRATGTGGVHVQEVLDVTGRARQRGRSHRIDSHSQALGPLGHGQDRLHVKLRVTYHSPVPDPVLTHLELGLDHEQEVGVVCCGPQQRLEHQGQGDEGQVAHHQAWGRSDILRSQRTDIGAVQGGDSGVCAQGPGQLPVAHVDGHDVLGATPQEHVGEAPRGGTRVQAAAALDARGQASLLQRIQRTGELVGSA